MGVYGLDYAVTESVFLWAVVSAAKKLGFSIDREYGKDIIFKHGERHRQRRIERAHSYNHEFGNGGHYYNAIALVAHPNSVVLCSKSLDSWTTLSDDSEDYSSESKSYTLLFGMNDWLEYTAFCLLAGEEKRDMVYEVSKDVGHDRLDDLLKISEEEFVRIGNKKFILKLEDVR